MPTFTVHSSRLGEGVRRNEAAVLIVAFGGGCWIGSLVTGMLLSRSDIVVEKNAVQSAHVIEPASVNHNPLVDDVKFGSVSSEVHALTGASKSKSESDIRFRCDHTFTAEPFTAKSFIAKPFIAEPCTADGSGATAER